MMSSLFFLQLLQNAAPADVNHVVTMYAAVLEDKQISLTFKVQYGSYEHFAW